MGVRLGSLIAVIAACVGLAAAQVTSPPPVCFGFNDTGPAGMGGSILYVSDAGGLTAHFVAPVSVTVERADLFVNFCWCAPPLVIELYQTSALGALPLGPLIATFAPTAGAFSASWHPFFPASPIAFSAGASYAVLIKAPFGCYAIHYDALGAQQLPYQFTQTAACPGTGSFPFPPTGQIGLRIRFRGLGCGPGPLASVAPIGIGCGEDGLFGSFTATLQAMFPPALGGVFNVALQSPFASTTGWLFWSVGTNTTGSGVFPGFPCLLYLDAASLAALNLAGAEPLVVSQLTSGSVVWQFAIPTDPAIVGVVIGLQAMVMGPSGTIPLGGGSFGQTTNALQLLIGY